MDFSGLAQQEQQAFEAFKQKYVAQNPPPTARKAEGLGWQFWLSIVWAVSSVIMVSTRTASEFYNAEILSGMTRYLALASSTNVLLAIEGGIVIAAALKAAQKKTFDMGLLEKAIYLIVFISLVAGVNASLGVIPKVSDKLLNAVRLGLVGAIGIGGSFVAWISGEVVGAQIARVLADRERVEKELVEAMRSYNEGLLASWNNSDEKAIVRSGVRARAVEARAEVREAKAERSAEQNLFHPRSAERGVEQGVEQSYADMVVEWLDRMYGEMRWEAEEDVPSAREIIRQIGSDIPPSSAHRGRKRWIREKLNGS